MLWREATAQHFAEQGGHFRPPDANGDLVALGKAFANTNIPSQVRCAPHTSQEMEAHAHWNRAANPRLAADGLTRVSGPSVLSYLATALRNVKDQKRVEAPDE